MSMDRPRLEIGLRHILNSYDNVMQLGHVFMDDRRHTTQVFHSNPLLLYAAHQRLEWHHLRSEWRHLRFNWQNKSHKSSNSKGWLHPTQPAQRLPRNLVQYGRRECTNTTFPGCSDPSSWRWRIFDKLLEEIRQHGPNSAVRKQPSCGKWKELSQSVG